MSLTHTYIPFSRERYEGVKDTSLLRTKSYAKTVRKLKSYYEIPAFSIINVWRGASEIVFRYDFPNGLLSLLNAFPLEKPVNANFVPVLAWREGDDQFFHRYKLWEDVGEILWLPVYNKEKVKASTFYIEIWNTNTVTGQSGLGLEEEGEGLGLEEPGILLGLEDEVGFADLLLEAAIKLYTSRLIVPTDFCLDDDVKLGEPTTCVDPIYYLENFEPIFGDYYLLVAPCERQLIKGVKAKPEFNLLRNRDDDTWHYVWMDVIAGNVFLFVDPANAVAPDGALGYFPLRINVGTKKTYKFELESALGEAGTHHFVATEEVAASEADLDVCLLQTVNEQSDALLYGFYLTRDSDGSIRPVVIQNQIVL